MFSESEWRYELVPVRYSDGSRDFKLEFGVAIKLALLKTESRAIVLFIGEPILRGNSDKLDQENVFHVYVSIRIKIKTAALALVKEEYRRRGIYLMMPQYN